MDESYRLEYRHMRNGGNYYALAEFRDSADVLNSQDWNLRGVSNITCAGNWYYVTNQGCWKNSQGNKFAFYTLTSGWHYWSLIFDHQHDTISAYFDGNFAGSTDYSGLTTMPHKVLIWNNINTAGATASFDDVVLMKYAQPEPICCVGLEESFPPCILGDCNCDCFVNVADIMEVASRWRTSCDNPDPDNNPDTPNYDPLYDMDKDGDIDVVDIMLVVKHWGETCG